MIYLKLKINSVSLFESGFFALIARLAEQCEPVRDYCAADDSELLTEFIFIHGLGLKDDVRNAAVVVG